MDRSCGGSAENFEEDLLHSVGADNTMLIDARNEGLDLNSPLPLTDVSGPLREMQVVPQLSCASAGSG